MKSSNLLAITFTLWTIFFICVQGGYHAEKSCGKKPRVVATAKTEQIEDGYCEAQKETQPLPKHSCLRAAVVEYSRIDGVDCKSTSQANLDVYERIIKAAKDNGANMIVFPEDGIMMGTARSMFPCLEEIPDPNNLVEDYNPCLEPSKFDQYFPILTRLSCFAHRYGLYLIANYGTKEKINKDSTNASGNESLPEGHLPKDGDDYLMLNTDVVFELSGRFIKRYRKWNPFTETEIFSKAPRLEHAYFDTDYGRFGVFTCFDMLFREPAIELVEQYKIDTAIFPTWWFDELPLLTAVQYQDGWSATNQVNLLAANIIKPIFGSLGSGIFSANKSVYAAAENYNSQKQVRRTKLLLATLQTSKLVQTCGENFGPKVIEFDTNVNYDNYKHKNYKLRASDAVRALDQKTEGEQSVCSGDFCCTIKFKLTSKSASDMKSSTSNIRKIVIIARDGPRPGFYQWYEQVCALATMMNPCNSCDNEISLDNLLFDEDAAVSFEELSIRATFSTKYVYPTCGHDVSKLVDRDQRILSCKRTSITSDHREGTELFDCDLKYVANKTNSDANKLYSFGLYGRIYEKDKKL